MTLKELLMKRKTKELLNLLRYNGLPFPLDVSKEKEAGIKEAYYDDNDYTVPFLLEYLEKDEPDWDEYEMDEAELEMFKERHIKQLELAGLVKSVEDKRDAMCEMIAAKLLDKDHTKEVYHNLSDRCVEVMRSVISEGSDRGTHVELEVDIKADDKFPVNVLRDLGYCDIEVLDAYDSPDEYEHIIKIIIPNEIRDVFTVADNKEEDHIRKERIFVMDCCYIAARYYDEATIPMVYRIYLEWCAQSGNEHLLNVEEFEDLAVKAQKREDSCYELYELNGSRYILGYSFSDNDEDTYEFLKDKTKYLNDCDEAFYIPSFEEGMEYRKNGYWPSRSGYAKLKQFITDFYLDEQYINNSGLQMFAMVGDAEDYLRNGFMSRDDVDREADETFYEIIMDLSLDSDVEDIIKNNEHLTIPVTDEARQIFREALEECLMQTNFPYLNGYTKENCPEELERNLIG